jgi:imidazolonepropionase-like amidohydrolase
MTLEDGDGGFIWLIDTREDLARKWPQLLTQKPDFIKTVLVHSEEYEKRRQDTTYYNWRGLNPALLPEIVQRAHAAGLAVTTHVETAADFHAAVVAGVDEITHIPGFRGDEREQLLQPQPFEIVAADAKIAASKKIVVVTTVGGIGFLSATGPDSLRRRAFDNLARRNLRVLKDAGVHIAIGSDGYRDNSSREVSYVRQLGVFTDMELLRLWSESTPRAIFPKRKVGCLEEGCEASFQVFTEDPSTDFTRVKSVRFRMKDGSRLPAFQSQ